jgi:hypothetical protein
MKLTAFSHRAAHRRSAAHRSAVGPQC